MPMVVTMRMKKTLDELEANNQVVFRYATENPNGSLHNIAGITNKQEMS